MICPSSNVLLEKSAYFLSLTLRTLRGGFGSPSWTYFELLSSVVIFLFLTLTG